MTTIYLTTSQQAHGDQTLRAAKQAEGHFAELSRITRAELIAGGLGCETVDRNSENIANWFDLDEAEYAAWNEKRKANLRKAMRRYPELADACR